MSYGVRNRSLWESEIEANFPRKYRRDSGPASAFSVVELSFPILLFIGRVSYADLTTLVLDVAARTAFPATRPEAQRRMQAANGRAKKKYENIRTPLFLLFDGFAVRMSEWWRMTPLRLFVHTHSEKASGSYEKDYRPMTEILPSRRSLKVLEKATPRPEHRLLPFRPINSRKSRTELKWSFNPWFFTL